MTHLFKAALLFFILLLQMQAFACDKNLAFFSRDCTIQDRMTRVRAALRGHKVDVDEIAEYRSLRFIDRSMWEYSKFYKTAPLLIYKPAPDTWTVWDQGIRSLFATSNFKDRLTKDFILNETTFSMMNKFLLDNGTTSIKDPMTDQKVKPGQYRKDQDWGAGFCHDGKQDMVAAIAKSDASMQRFQQKWESRTGILFSQLVQDENQSSEKVQADFLSNMVRSTPECDKKNSQSYFINYTPSTEVSKRINWLQIFIKKNLQLYSEGKPALAPIEFAAFVQKWFVSIHPFSDGNGRTSRALQDAILANFGLPFAPGGDLQNDATDEFENYLDLNYQKIEAMLTFLENCATEIKNFGSQEMSFQCQSVGVLNAMAISKQ